MHTGREVPHTDCRQPSCSMHPAGSSCSVGSSCQRQYQPQRCSCSGRCCSSTATAVAVTGMDALSVCVRGRTVGGEGGPVSCEEVMRNDYRQQTVINITSLSPLWVQGTLKALLSLCSVGCMCTCSLNGSSSLSPTHPQKTEAV